MIVLVIAVAATMVMAHELAHVVTTVAFGGSFEGIVVKYVLAVGVKIRVDALSARQVAWTLIAGPLAELLVVAAAWAIQPRAWGLWLMLLGVQWVMNLTPWPWFPTDGRRLWTLLHAYRVASDKEMLGA